MSSDRSTTTAMAFLRRGRSVSGWKIVPLAGLQANLHDPHIVVDLRSKASGAADIWRPASRGANYRAKMAEMILRSCAIWSPSWMRWKMAHSLAFIGPKT